MLDGPFVGGGWSGVEEGYCASSVKCEAALRHVTGRSMGASCGTRASCSVEGTH